MIVRWPGQIQAGSECDLAWYFPDIMPTLAEVGGATTPTGIDGLSVVPTLLGEQAAGRRQQGHDFLYWEHTRSGLFQQAVRIGDWKGLRPQPGAPLQVYDLKTDAGETRDLATERSKIASAIEEILKTCRRDPPPQVEPAKPAGRRWRQQTQE